MSWLMISALQVRGGMIRNRIYYLILMIDFPRVQFRSHNKDKGDLMTVLNKYRSFTDSNIAAKTIQVFLHVIHQWVS